MKTTVQTVLVAAGLFLGAAAPASFASFALPHDARGWHAWRESQWRRHNGAARALIRTGW